MTRGKLQLQQTDFNDEYFIGIVGIFCMIDMAMAAQ